MRGMVIDMNEAKLQTAAQIEVFLEGTHDIVLKVPKVERYDICLLHVALPASLGQYLPAAYST